MAVTVTAGGDGTTFIDTDDVCIVHYYEM